MSKVHDATAPSDSHIMGASMFAAKRHLPSGQPNLTHKKTEIQFCARGEFSERVGKFFGGKKVENRGKVGNSSLPTAARRVLSLAVPGGGWAGATSQYRLRNSHGRVTHRKPTKKNRKKIFFCQKFQKLKEKKFWKIFLKITVKKNY